MKKVFISVSVIVLMATACTKDLPAVLDNSLTTLTNTEDNHNGGGGDNVTPSGVPEAVISAFNSRFKDATRIEWKKLSDGTFKVEFYMGSTKWQVIFDANGKILKQEHK